VVVNALCRARPGLDVEIGAAPSAVRALEAEILDPDVADRVTLVPTSGALPAGAVHVFVHLLDWSTDDDAAHLLAEFAERLIPDAEVLLVEEWEHRMWWLRR
jgi:hypothetical protein